MRSGSFRIAGFVFFVSRVGKSQVDGAFWQKVSGKQKFGKFFSDAQLPPIIPLLANAIATNKGWID